MYGKSNHHSNETTRTTLRKYAQRAGKNKHRARSRDDAPMARTAQIAVIVARRTRSSMAPKDAGESRGNKRPARGCGKEGCAHNAPHDGKCGADEVQKHANSGVERRRSKIRHFLGIWTIHCGECQTRFWGFGCEPALFKHLLHVLNGECTATVKGRWKGAY